MHHSFIADFTQEFAAFQFMHGTHNMAFAVNVMNYPGIEIRGENPSETPDGTVNAFNFDAALTYARTFNAVWHTGINIKYLYEKYYMASAAGWSIDLGLIRQWNSFSFSLALQNMGKMSKLNEIATPLPFISVLGAAYTISDEILGGRPVLAAEMQYVKDEAVYYRFGLDFPLKEYFNLRTGLIFGMEDIRYSAGLSINYKNYHLDYAFSPYPYQLGDSHRIAVRFDL
jgi:hypothetical protein